MVTRKRAVVYVRQSLDATGEGLGIDRQERACRQLCEMRGWDVLEVVPDNSVSAFSGKDRPGWTKVLGMIDAGSVDLVVAWHMDRITRSMLDLETLIIAAERHGVGVATVTGDIDLTTDVGRMVARILAAVARAEVERKSARQKAAHAQRREAGKPFWGVRPFGYERDGTIVPEEAERIREACRRLLDGAVLAHIANDWNAEGYRSMTGIDWTSHTVRQVVRHPRVAGWNTHREQDTDGKWLPREIVGKGNWEPILDEDTWNAVVHVLDAPERDKGGGQRKGLLVGIAKCPKCQATVRQSRSPKRKTTPQYRTYMCRNGGHVTCPADAVDAVVKESLLSIHPETLYRLLGVGDDREEGVDVGALRERQAVLRTNRQTAADDHYVHNLIDRETFTKSLARIDAELDGIEKELSDAARGTALDGIDVEHLADVYDDLPDERKRALIRRVFVTISLKQRGKARKDFRKSDVLMMRRPLMDEAEKDAVIAEHERKGGLTDVQVDELIEQVEREQNGAT